jgi:hypothetical protein
MRFAGEACASDTSPRPSHPSHVQPIHHPRAGSDIESEVFGSSDGGSRLCQTMPENVGEAEGAPTAPINESDVSFEDQVVVVFYLYARTFITILTTPLFTQFNSIS